MTLRELSHNQPAKRYLFAVHDAAGDWGEVEVSAHDIDTARAKAQRDLARIPDTALRVGFQIKLLRVSGRKL